MHDLDEVNGLTIDKELSLDSCLSWIYFVHQDLKSLSNSQFSRSEFYLVNLANDLFSKTCRKRNSEVIWQCFILGSVFFLSDLLASYI